MDSEGLRGVYQWLYCLGLAHSGCGYDLGCESIDDESFVDFTAKNAKLVLTYFLALDHCTLALTCHPSIG